MHSIITPGSPGKLARLLAIYFSIILIVTLIVLSMRPDGSEYLPVGGVDALDDVEIQFREFIGSESRVQESTDTSHAYTAMDFLQVALQLFGTLIIMLPIAWTYVAMNYERGFQKSQAQALMVLPLCATTVVLLIQDSLALAFGLAALVAAVRFRVALEEPMDGVFIFAAISAGLAAGIGFLDIAFVMSLFFCATCTLMWSLNFGQNPTEDKIQARKKAKIEASDSES